MLIVGSLIAGWTPGLIYFALVCDQECLINRKTYATRIQNLLIASFSMSLLIIKTALNSYIYVARMQEIKVRRW